MIGLSVSDILKVLDQVPGWKAVLGLPKRVKELEERVAALEGRPKVPAAPDCPLCGAAMKVTASRAHPLWGSGGIQQRTLACTACEHTETREFDPAKA